MAKFLDERGIVVRKPALITCCFSLVLVSINQSNGIIAWVDGIETLLQSQPAKKNMLPNLYAEIPNFFRNMRIQESGARDP
ncbi:hypothetical protein ACLK1T_06425 [Escherichia coli]